MRVKTRNLRRNENPAVTLAVGNRTRVVLCGWFARCTRPATGTTAHRILGQVPTCDRCAAFAAGVSP